MRLDVRDPKDQEEATKTRILNLDTGRFMKGVIAADDATGQVLQYVKLAGKTKVHRAGPNKGEPVISSGWINFEFVQGEVCQE